MHAHPEVPANQGEIRRYVRGVANNSPEVFAELQNAGRQLGPDGALIEVGAATEAAFERVLGRWARAFHYRETGRIVPTEARVFVRWFGNADIEQIPPGALVGPAHALVRNRINIGNQFAYITKNDPNHLGLGYYTAAFRRAFLAIMLVDCDHDLDDWPER